MICCDRRVRSPPNDLGRPDPCLLEHVEADRRRLDDGAGETKPQIKHVWFNMYVDHFERVDTSENVYAELGGRGVRSPIILVESYYTYEISLLILKMWTSFYTLNINQMNHSIITSFIFVPISNSNTSRLLCLASLPSSIFPFHSFVRLRVRHSRIPLATATITCDFTAVDNDIEKRE